MGDDAAASGSAPNGIQCFVLGRTEAEDGWLTPHLPLPVEPSEMQQEERRYRAQYELHSVEDALRTPSGLPSPAPACMDEEMERVLSIARATCGGNMAGSGMKRTFVGVLNGLNLFFGTVASPHFLSTGDDSVVERAVSAPNASNRGRNDSGRH